MIEQIKITKRNQRNQKNHSAKSH